MHTALDAFETGFNRLVVALASLVAVSLGLMALAIPLNLFLIKFHLGSLWWLFSTVEYALSFGVFAAAPWVLQQGAHVRIDMLSTSLAEKPAALLDAGTNIFGALICSVLAVYGTRAAIIEFVDQTMPEKDVQIAVWIVVSVFTVSFILSAIEFLLRLRPNRVLAVGAEKSPLKESF